MLIGHRVSVKRPRCGGPRISPNPPNRASLPTVVEQGGREEGPSVTGRPFCFGPSKEKPGNEDGRGERRYKFAPAKSAGGNAPSRPEQRDGTLVQRSLTIRVRRFPSPQRRAKRISRVRRVFLHQRTARRFTTLRPAPRKYK